MSFSGSLRLQDLEDGVSWKVLDGDLTWTTEGGTPIVIPEGFITDLASVPWFLRSSVSALGKHNRAAVLHDFFYRTPKFFFNKAWADKEFLKAMEYSEVHWYTRQKIYRGVKYGGGPSWAKYR